MKIRTNDLKDKALDWAVAKSEGLTDADLKVGKATTKAVVLDGRHRPVDMRSGQHFRPSTNPTQGQPIMEAAKISVIWAGEWSAYGRDTPEGDRNPDGYGETALIAAMRCRVVLKLGQEVDIPEELL